MTESLHPLDHTRITDIRDELARAGVHTVIAAVVNQAGLTLAKSFPVRKLPSVLEHGLGAAPVWHVFCIDAGIAFTDGITTVGDLRLRLDLGGLRNLGGGLAWAPAGFFAQDGEPVPACARGLLTRIEQRLAESGLHALVGHELEFVLVAPDGGPLGDAPWVPYGLTGLLDRESFLDELQAAALFAGLSVEQLHCEYGRNQFEFSLSPAAPVGAADAVVLARTIVGRVARRHGLQASFSPAPFPGLVGNGAHQHFSLTQDGAPVFGGGDRPHGITAAGGAAIGGLVGGLPEIRGLLTGSVLSGHRLVPGTWSGAWACWGLENREAAVRFIAGGPGDPRGSNVEVKSIDPSANVYIASAAVLALALHGISTGSAMPEEIADDPGSLTEGQRAAAGVTLLSDRMPAVLDALDSSSLARALLGDEIVDTSVATRRWELRHHGERTPEDLAAQFRLAWSV